MSNCNKSNRKSKTNWNGCKTYGRKQVGQVGHHPSKSDWNKMRPIQTGNSDCPIPMIPRPFSNWATRYKFNECWKMESTLPPWNYVGYPRNIKNWRMNANFIPVKSYKMPWVLQRHIKRLLNEPVMWLRRWIMAHVAAYSPHGYCQPKMTDSDEDGIGIQVKKVSAFASLHLFFHDRFPFWYRSNILSRVFGFLVLRCLCSKIHNNYNLIAQGCSASLCRIAGRHRV